MAKTNKEKQQEYVARQRARGLLHFQAWLTPAVADAVRKFLKELDKG